MNERIHKYFYEELSTEERLSLLRDVEASEELKKEFVEYQTIVYKGISKSICLVELRTSGAG